MLEIQLRWPTVATVHREQRRNVMYYDKLALTGTNIYSPWYHNLIFLVRETKAGCCDKTGADTRLK